MNADIDRRIPEIVYATHLLTGLKVKIYKSFVGFPKLDPSTGR